MSSWNIVGHFQLLTLVLATDCKLHTQVFSASAFLSLEAPSNFQHQGEAAKLRAASERAAYERTWRHLGPSFFVGTGLIAREAKRKATILGVL